MYLDKQGMFSVFSNINKKPSEQIRLFQNCAGANLTRFLIAGPKDESLYMLKPDALPWLIWINEKILFTLPQLDVRTVAVRIRIATGMLNKLEASNIISKDICIKYHSRLIKNTKELLSLIWTEDLPF